MKILFTGGGTGGHVIPNIAIINELKKNKNVQIFYIGSKDGIEKKLIKDQGIVYKEIETGKLRRYLSKKNIEDFFKVFRGIKQAKAIIEELKPDVIFSKGGFVSVPVVLGARNKKIPIIIHESDITPGLANKISLPFADKICISFPETIKYVNKNKTMLTGTPVRGELFDGDENKAYKYLGMKKEKPIITIMGGSLGSECLNRCIRKSINELTKVYQIVHICGKGKVAEEYKQEGYVQYEYVGDELKDILKVTDLIISRAGANSLFEILMLSIPNILIPLSKKASRGDQIVNAKSFEKQGFSYVLEEEKLTSQSLIHSINKVLEEKDKYIKNMKNTKLKSGTQQIVELIESYEKGGTTK